MASQPPMMTKSRPNPPPQREGSAAPSKRGGRWPLVARIAISVIVAWHLTAVFLAPLSIPPTSWLVTFVAQGPIMQRYLDLFYLNHGYGFFAPDPGPGHLIQYEIFDDRGAVTKQGSFPNSDVQRPRLFYHRHFMLAEQADPGIEDVRDPDLWKRKQLEAYARYLLRTNEGQAVRVRWVEHRLLTPDEGYLLREHERSFPGQPYGGVKPNDPATYRTLYEVTQRRSDLGLEAPSGSPANQTNLWQGGRQNVASPWTGVTR
jgi:hypothetical protein